MLFFLQSASAGSYCSHVVPIQQASLTFALDVRVVGKAVMARLHLLKFNLFIDLIIFTVTTMQSCSHVIANSNKTMQTGI